MEHISSAGPAVCVHHADREQACNLAANLNLSPQGSPVRIHGDDDGNIHSHGYCDDSEAAVRTASLPDVPTQPVYGKICTKVDPAPFVWLILLPLSV